MARKSTTPKPAKAHTPLRAENRNSNPSPEPSRSTSVADEVSGVSGPTPEAAASFPVVGIGASAGGLEAFTALLTALPADTGMVFVLIQHMDPHHQSVLTSLLQRATVMPVQEVTDGRPVEPNHVYVIPPNSLMSVSRGVLALSPRNQHSIKNLPIDHFFQALAEDLGSRAIGVVLSGTASDGTQGLRAIKERGGVTFAQDKESAQYPGMPLSAIAAGCVDFILPPGRIAIELARINGHPYFRSVHDDEFSLPEGAVRDGIGAVCRLLKTATGVDFHLYKPTTIGRRVARRMALRKLSALQEYLQLLTEDRTELNLCTRTSSFMSPASSAIRKAFRRCSE